MPSLSFISSLSVLTIHLLLPITIFGDRTCFPSANFTTNDPYDKNLNELTSYLAYAAPLTGSSLASKGRGENKVYGLSMCLGNYSAVECKNCILNAANNLRSLCSNNKGAIQWEGVCLYKYLNVDFFGNLTQSIAFGTDPSTNLTINHGNYMPQILQFLGSLSIVASESPKFSLSERMEIGEKINRMEVLGIVQCSVDIPSIECRSCFNESLKLLPMCCSVDAVKSAVVYGGSCLIAYYVMKY